MEFNVEVLRNDLDRIDMLNERDREDLLLVSMPSKKNSKIIERLLNLGTNVDTMNVNGDTALVLACDKDNIEAVKLLVENGANVNYAGSSRGTPLYLACQNGNKAIVSYLVYRGADINSTSNFNGETALFQACRGLSKDIVKFLIQEGANVNIADLHGVTPVSLLCRCVGREECAGAFSVLKLLIRNGANVNTLEGDNITTPLLIASRYKNSRLIALLVENGAIVKPEYGEVVKNTINSIVENMFPSLEERQEIKEALIARDLEGFGRRLHDYLKIEDLIKEDNDVNNMRKIHKIKRYVYSLKDGEEFRKVVREIREIRRLIAISKNDIHLDRKPYELSEKLEINMNIFKLVNKLQVRLENLEEEKCWNTIRGRAEVRPVDEPRPDKTLRPSL